MIGLWIPLSLLTGVDSAVVQNLDTAHLVVKQSPLRYSATGREWKVSPEESFGKTGEDILKEIPGVQMSDGRVQLRGNSNVQILLDGMPIEASDLVQIAGHTLDRIEVQNIPDARQSAEGSGGLIQLTSRGNQSKGISGQLGAGLSHPWLGSVQQGFRWGDGLWGFTEQFEIRGKHRVLHKDIWERYLLTQNQISQDLDKMELNHQLRTALERKLNDKKFVIQLNYRNGLFQQLAQGELNQMGSIQSKKDSSVRAQMMIENIYSIEKLGRNFSPWKYSLGIQKILAHFDQSKTIGNQVHHNDTENDVTLWSPKADWNLGPYNQLWSIGAAGNYRRFDLLTAGQNYGIWTLQNALYTQKKWTNVSQELNFGARLEWNFWVWDQADLATWQTWDVYPSSSYLYHFSDEIQLQMSSGIRTQIPKPHIVMPIQRWDDNNTKNVGNPQLQPQKTWNNQIGLALNPNTKSHYEFNLFGNQTWDLFQQERLLNQDTLVVKQINQGYAWEQGVEILWQWQGLKFLENNSSMSLKRREVEGQKAHFSYELKSDQSLKWKLWQSGMVGQFESEDYSPAQIEGKRWSVDVYARLNFKGYGNLSFAAKNLWGQRIGDLEVEYDDYFSRVKTHEGMTWNLQMMWNIGRSELKNRDKKPTREDEENW